MKNKKQFLKFPKKIQLALTDGKDRKNLFLNFFKTIHPFTEPANRIFNYLSEMRRKFYKQMRVSIFIFMLTATTSNFCKKFLK